MQQCGVHARPWRHARPGTALLSEVAFDAETLEVLDAEREVRIETKRRDGSTRTTIIWVVVDGSDAFVRSWKGERGHWYRSAIETPDDVTLTVRKMRLPIAVKVADDEDSVERCSRALALKYAGDPSTDSMIKPYNLATTLRLLPR